MNLSTNQISRRTTVTIGFVLGLISCVGTSGYFVGTAHTKIDSIDSRIKSGEIRTGDNMDVLLNIERRLSRIEGKLENITLHIK